MHRLLVIDDDPLVRATLVAILEGAGYAVTEANDGHHGLAIFDTVQPDLVITDIVMPEVEGIETIRQMRLKAPTLPILAISGGGRGTAPDYLRMAQRLGATDVLAKPFEADDLVAVVARCIAA